MEGFIGKKNPHRYQYNNRKPHSEPNRRDVFFGKFFPKNIQEVKKDKENDGCYQWHTQPAFADDGA